MRSFTITLSLLFFACNSSSSDASSSTTSSAGGSPALSVADCTPRCNAKLGGCGAPTSQVSQLCQQTCASGLTETQATCLENKSCDEIAAANSIQGLCPTTSSGGTTTTTSSTTSTSSGGPCSATPTCDAEGDGTSTCEMNQGIPVTTTVKCQAGKCKNGQCGACSKKEDCTGKSLASCTCADDYHFGVSVGYDCVSGQCEATTSPDCTSCAPHGGVK